MARKRVRTSPSSGETRPPSPLHEQSATRSGYIPNLTPRERVDMILSDIREHHRWSIKDLIYHMVQTPSSQKNAHSETRRARLVSQAIYGQPEVVKQLASISNDIYTTGASDQVSRLQSELQDLVHGNVLGEFELDIDPGEVDIPGLATRAQSKAPELWRLLVDIMTPPQSSRDTSTVHQGSIFMICSILASTFAPRKSNNFPTLIGLYLHAMGVKRRVISFLAGLGINSAYKTIMARRKELADLGQKRLKQNARATRKNLIVSWDNFDYNQTVRHQTIRDPSEHISATTGKLCIGQSIPAGGLLRSMFHPEVPLTPYDIYMAPGNQNDDVFHQCQRHWIAEAIRNTHREAVEKLFAAKACIKRGKMKLQVYLIDWPEFPTVKRLQAQKTVHYSLGPMLYNEGTIEGTYKVIENVFLGQLGDDDDTDLDGLLQLVYGDQKTVSLLRAVKKERAEASRLFDRLSWILPIPGLFHWRMNYLDMIFELYAGSNHPTVESTIHHNKVCLGCVQGHKSPFHHKEEVATRSFDARVTAMFYRFVPSTVNLADAKDVDDWIQSLGRGKFLDIVDQIRRSLFHFEEQQSKAHEREGKPVDYEFSAHAKFLQQMEIYKSLKLAIKLGDIGIIQRVFPQCCLLFSGTKKSRYAFLSLYMTWLTQTKAADPELQTAILANGLVNLRGTEDGWFEIDRLNEFFNLHMKTLMATRRTSTLDITTMFRRTALTASYCTDLKELLEATFGEYSNGRHQNKDASRDIRHLAYQISKTIQKQPSGRTRGFQPPDILTETIGEKLFKAVQNFNDIVVNGQWAQEVDFSKMTSTPIAVLDEIEENDPE